MLSQTFKSGTTVIEKVGDTTYEFTSVKLTSNNTLTVGIESGCTYLTERDLFCLNTLCKTVNNGIFIKFRLDEDRRLATVSCSTNQTNKKIMLAKPNQESFTLDQSDFAIILNHIRSRIMVI